jgi:hypothetical protein
MPVDRQYDKIVFECDSCDETFTGEPGEEFVDAWASAKQEGWRATKIGEEWVRGCPRCGV